MRQRDSRFADVKGVVRFTRFVGNGMLELVVMIFGLAQVRKKRGYSFSMREYKEMQKELEQDKGNDKE